jgi:flagellar motor component MotA
MDLTTALGLAAGATVILTFILLGGDLRTFCDMHAAIVIFGGSFAVSARQPARFDYADERSAANAFRHQALIRLA